VRDRFGQFGVHTVREAKEVATLRRNRCVIADHVFENGPFHAFGVRRLADLR